MSDFCRASRTPFFQRSVAWTNSCPTLEDRWNAADVLPDEVLPDGNKTKDAIYYGMPELRDLFSSRQLLAHGHCVQAFRGTGTKQMRTPTRLSDLRKTAWAYVGIAFDKMINRNKLANPMG